MTGANCLDFGCLDGVLAITSNFLLSNAILDDLTNLIFKVLFKGALLRLFLAGVYLLIHLLNPSSFVLITNLQIHC